MQEKIKILKVKFDKVTTDEALKTTLNWLKGDKFHRISTPNPEFLLEAQKNQKFLEILNKSDLNIPDGIGILWASKYSDSTKNIKSKFIKIIKAIPSMLSVVFYPKHIKKVLPERVTGTDLMQKICKEVSDKNIKIFLLGASEGVAEKTKEILQKTYPNIKIVGTYCGSPSQKENEIIIKKINSVSPDILFVAYGAPAQEIWINRNQKKLKSVKLAIGVGGAFDFIAGKRKRAPVFMQKIGLEWLYRLFQQPSRIKRIYNAVIKFPIKVIFS